MAVFSGGRENIKFWVLEIIVLNIIYESDITFGMYAISDSSRFPQ
jgi:hypothetical protein